MTTPNIYIPAGCKPLSESKREQQIRLMIQGYSGNGKTFAALTFPNPIVVNLDRGLGAHATRSDVIEVPLYDASYVRDWSKNLQYHPNLLKDMITKWVETEGSKLTESQTLVFDGNTGMQNAYHRWYESNKVKFVTKSGNLNEFAEWTVKKQFYGQVMETFKTLRCHVVFLCHEIDLKDKNGVQGPTYSGKIRPLLTGAFGDELGSHFTDVFRAHSSDKPDVSKMKKEEIYANWKMAPEEMQAWVDTFPRNTIYYWQTDSDNIFDGKCSSLVNYPRFLPATYESFKKFSR